MRSLTRMCLAAAPLAILAACEQPQSTGLMAPSLSAAAKKPSGDPVPSSPVPVASGLNNPRGIAFDNKGTVYVAEAGTGAGGISTAGQCQQDPNPATSGHTGRISRIENGVAVPVVSGLPSSINSLGAVFGIADVAFVGPKLYGLLNAGCGHGVPDVPASVIAVNNGQYDVVANLSAFRAANVPANLGPDVEPDGDWYSMIASGGVLYAVDANGGQIVTVKPGSGKVDRVVDVSATQGHIVPTAVGELQGDVFFGNLQTFPAVEGRSNVFVTRHNGTNLHVVGSGLMTVLGVASDKDYGYALESFHCVTGFPCFPGPWAAGTGDVVRDNLTTGARDTIVKGLTFPSSIRFGPDGALYISNKSYNLPPGSGEILKVTFSK